MKRRSTIKNTVIVSIYVLILTILIVTVGLYQENLRYSFKDFFVIFIIAEITGAAMIFAIQYWVINPIFEQCKLKTKESEHDKLTGICNRTRFDKKIDFYNNACKSIGVVFVDVNDLKKTNDTYGHDTGDALIRAVAHTIRELKIDCMDYYRFGGDEFVMIFSNITNAELERAVKDFLNNIEKIKLNTSMMKVSVACGIAYEDKNIDVNHMIKQADKRMYEDKRKIKKE